MCGFGYFGDATVLAGHTDFFLGYRAASASTQVPWVVGKNGPDIWLGAVDLTDYQMHDWSMIHCLALDICFWIAPTGAREHTMMVGFKVLGLCWRFAGTCSPFLQLEGFNEC